MVSPRLTRTYKVTPALSISQWGLISHRYFYPLCTLCRDETLNLFRSPHFHQCVANSSAAHNSDCLRIATV